MYDALDDIIEAALCKVWGHEPGSQVTCEAAWAVRDALVAHGHIEERVDIGASGHMTALVVFLEHHR